MKIVIYFFNIVTLSVFDYSIFLVFSSLKNLTVFAVWSGLI